MPTGWSKYDFASSKRSSCKCLHNGASLKNENRRLVRKSAKAQDWWLEQVSGAMCLMTSQGPFSVYNPDCVFTNCGWDAQTAGALFTDKPDSILLLGMGGGTVARQCRMLYPRARIVAVEADADIIRLARRHFALDTLNIDVMCTTAEKYIGSSRRKFDVIIDDAWPIIDVRSRSIYTSSEWLNRLKRRLRSGGIVGINSYSAQGDAKSRLHVLRGLKSAFQCVREIQSEGRVVTVLVGGESLPDARQARRAIKSLPSQARAPLSALRFRSI